MNATQSPAAPAALKTTAARRAISSRVIQDARAWTARYALVAVFGVIVVLFSILNPSVFPTVANAKTIASTQATVALLALAAMLPLIVGQFDISVGYQFGLGQGLCAVLIIQHHLPAGLAVAAVLAVGVAIGLTNGLLVTKLGLNSFIATLGVGILVLGATEWLTKDLTISGAMPSSFVALSRSTALGVPLPFVYVLVACLALWLTLEYTAWGRHCYATGGNARAALLSGVRTDRTTIQCYALTGLLSAAAGCLSVMILGASSPTVGLGALLPAFAGAFLGSTSIRPGRFNALGTVIAVYLVACGITGLQQLGAQFYVTDIFNGAALLIAVGLARYASQRRR
jgi:ribose transport system permease protein